MLIINTHITRNIIFFLIIQLFLIQEFYAQSKDKSFEAGLIYLSTIIAEEKYSSSELTDLEVIDSLYKDAVLFYDNDISEALLALTFATIPFNQMPVKIPLFDLRIPLRLPSVNEKLFQLKKNNSPGIVYFDSRINGGQDKDKVAHFFGNAFLSYNVTFFNASKFLGLFVEMFESTFKVSGGIDFRDLQTNYLGEFFGYSLRRENSISPSDFFNVYSLFYFNYN